jgi:hypothetical protein
MALKRLLKYFPEYIPLFQILGTFKIKFGIAEFPSESPSEFFKLPEKMEAQYSSTMLNLTSVFIFQNEKKMKNYRKIFKRLCSHLVCLIIQKNLLEA